MVKEIKTDKNTEEQIFEAAREVFIEKGFDGARMEDIAQRGGINKALLHYYYRSKEKLFTAIFERVFNEFMPSMIHFMELDKPLVEKIEYFVDSYLNMIAKNPFLPLFIINTINRNPQALANAFNTVLSKNEHPFKKFSEFIKKEIDNGTIEPIEPEHLIVNLIALCIFPIIAKPIMQTVLFDNDKKRYQNFLGERNEVVKKFIIYSITKR